MQESTSDNMRIVKNTLLLYVRMFLIMAVSLYTSRVVLAALGVTDYGIFNVVGGLVTIFSFLNAAMVTSTQRYLTFYLGKGDQDKLTNVFTTSIQVHAIISVIVLVLAETIGLWFLYTQMVIPQERFHAALWVFHFSVLTMMVQIMSVPYNSIIVSHEQMGAFAYISIMEVSFKLLIAYLLTIVAFDKLIAYAILIVLIQLLIRFVYIRYCLKHFPECKVRRIWMPSLLREIGSFAGWNLWGNLAGTLFGTGLNLLLNVFFGPVVNAARGVAHQVEAALVKFSSNFQMAVNPQITKSYAKNEIQKMYTLLFRASKFSYFLIMIFALPIMFEAEAILDIWLKTPPEHSAIFLRLTLCIVMIDTLARPLMTAAAATGDVKLYQSLMGGIMLLIVPVAYLVLKLGGSPSSVYVVHLTISIIASFVRLFIIRHMIRFPISEYFIKAIVPVLQVTTLSTASAFLIKTIFSDGIIYSFLVIALSFFAACAMTYAIGFTTNERKFIKNKAAEMYVRVVKKQ